MTEPEDKQFIRNVFIFMGAAHLSDTPENRDLVLLGLHHTRKHADERARETTEVPNG